MPAIGRRSFLTLAATAVSGYARALKVVGVQLYTVRSILPKKPLETLRAIEQIGYREVEVTADHLDAIWPSLQQTSLKAVSAHLNDELFMREQAKLPAALDDAKKRGIEYVVCPYVKPSDRGGVEVIRKLGDTLNAAGELCRKAGLSLCYHNHAFEYQSTPDGRLLDVLMKTADPKLVSLELDVMWAHVGGVDPVSILKQYGDRIPLVHLKNVAPGVETRYNEEIPDTAFRDLGNGAVDIPAVLRAAKQAGVKHYFVEQDQTPGDPLQSLRQSFQYLEGLKD
jgi:sugar phosphate isomerase/epimerase